MGIDDEEPWREADGKPHGGPVEWVDAAGRRGSGDGASLTWNQIGHSDDIRYWRPDMRHRGYGRR